MRPTLYPRLVNGRFGDPALFVETLHRRDALLFDMGDAAILYCFVFLYFVFAGPGPISLDAAMGRRKEVEQVPL